MAYTNSKLVNHTHLSPNHYNGRNHSIDKRPHQRTQEIMRLPKAETKRKGFARSAVRAAHSLEKGWHSREPRIVAL